MPLRSYRQLEVWKRSIELIEAVYRATAQLPSDEKYGLKSQQQRAAVSIAANIAEGYGRSHRAEYLHHLSIARGSLFEVETLLTISGRLKLVRREDLLPCWQLSQQIGQMLTKLMASLSAPETRTPRPETR